MHTPLHRDIVFDYTIAVLYSGITFDQLSSSCLLPMYDVFLLFPLCSQDIYVHNMADHTAIKHIKVE